MPEGGILLLLTINCFSALEISDIRVELEELQYILISTLFGLFGHFSIQGR
jgi:hypothetical protein